MEWISVKDRLPEIKKDSCQEFIVACKRKSNGKTYVFSAQYLNEMELVNTNTYEDELFSGWHENKAHYEFDDYLTPIENGEEGDIVTHWMPLPEAPKEQA